MNLPVPSVGNTDGPQYAIDLNSCLSIIDGHTHAPGSGVQITPDGINITKDLGFNGNNAITLRTSRYNVQSAVLTAVTDVGCVYVVGNELYYNDVTGGHQVKLTNNGVVNATSSGISSGTASASFVSSILTVVSAPGVAGNIDAASLIVRYPGSYPSPTGNYISIQAPVSVGAYALTLPANPPGATLPLVMDTVGNVTASQVNGAQIVSNVNLQGTQIRANNNIVVVANTNGSNSLAIIRGTVATDGSVLNGEGFSSSGSGGIFTLTWDNPFASAPTVVVTVEATPPGELIAANVTATPSTTAAGVRTWDVPSGTLLSKQFSFIAIGIRA